MPWLVRWKGHLPAGRTFDQPVIQLDIAPTALAAAGLPIPGEVRFDGVNLLPHLRGQNEAPPHPALCWRFGRQTAVRKGDWTLVEAEGSKGRMLFNLRTDIGQQKDLSAAEPEIARELQDAWDTWNNGNIAPAWTSAVPED